MTDELVLNRLDRTMAVTDSRETDPIGFIVDRINEVVEGGMDPDDALTTVVLALTTVDAAFLAHSYAACSPDVRRLDGAGRSLLLQMQEAVIETVRSRLTWVVGPGGPAIPAAVARLTKAPRNRLPSRPGQFN